jgi:hypothetical protein
LRKIFILKFRPNLHPTTLKNLSDSILWMKFLGFKGIWALYLKS